VPETVVHLVRHGQVENPRRVLYGRLPGYHLSPRGRAQGDLLAAHFAGTPLAAVVASPLERAQETAAPIAAAHGLRVRTDLRLIETSNIFEGAAGNVAWYILRHPGLWWKLRDLRTPSWGERNVDMAERVRAAVDAARSEFAGRHVVLVSHQAPIWVARLAFEHRPLTHWPGRRRCTLASVSTLTFDDDRLTSVTYAEPAASALLGPTPAARGGAGPRGRLIPDPGGSRRPDGGPHEGGRPVREPLEGERPATRDPAGPVPPRRSGGGS
jgi:broad specificity phosphatase PhoE